MRTPVFAVVVLAFVLVTPAAGQEGVLPPGVRVVADGISAETLARDLAYLASDELRGRDTGTPGFDAAAEYIVERLKAAGIEPAGDDGSYRQHYDLVELRVDTADAWVEIGDQRFRFGDDLVLRSFTGAIDTAAPVVYVGHGWHAPDRGLDPYAGLDLRGAVVLAHAPRATLAEGGVQQIGRVVVGARSVFAEAAARGAIAVLFVTGAGEDGEWARLRDTTLLRRELEPPVPSAYAAAPVTSGFLSAPALDAVLAGEALDRATLTARGEARDYPASFRLKRQVHLHVPLASATRTRPYNLVAKIEGSDPRLRDQVVTVASHLDGAVGTREVEGDAIYNSADDNATGSAATLSIAEQLMKGPRPARSVVFIWDSGEERGLWGTRQFVHDPPVPLTDIVAHVNVDMIGATRAPGTADAESADVTGPNEVFLIGPGVLSPTADALITRLNDAYLGLSLNRRDDTAESEFFYPRTDAGPFLERGILTIGFTTGTHDRYHLPSDEAGALDPIKMQAVARTVLATVWTLASVSERPRIERERPASVPDYR